MRIKLKKNLIFQDINYEIIEDDTFKNYLNIYPSRCISLVEKPRYDITDMIEDANSTTIAREHTDGEFRNYG